MRERQEGNGGREKSKKERKKVPGKVTQLAKRRRTGRREINRVNKERRKIKYAETGQRRKEVKEIRKKEEVMNEMRRKESRKNIKVNLMLREESKTTITSNRDNIWV